jgi:hypothetical protein
VLTLSGREDTTVSAPHYALLAALIFMLVAVVQLIRAVAGWPVTIRSVSIPVWASWVAFVVAAALAWLGFTASHG